MLYQIYLFIRLFDYFLIIWYFFLLKYYDFFIRLFCSNRYKFALHLFYHWEFFLISKIRFICKAFILFLFFRCIFHVMSCHLETCVFVRCSCFRLVDVTDLKRVKIFLCKQRLVIFFGGDVRWSLIWKEWKCLYSNSDFLFVSDFLQRVCYCDCGNQKESWPARLSNGRKR